MLIDESLELFSKLKNSEGNDDNALDLVKKHREKRSRRQTHIKKHLTTLHADLDGRLSSSEGNHVYVSMNSKLSPNEVYHDMAKEDTISAIVVAPRVNLKDAVVAGTNVGLLTVFDSLKPFEQLLLKFSSVIGLKFSRTTLESVLHSPNIEHSADAVRRMFELNIFRCTMSDRSDAPCSCDQNRSSVKSQPDSGFCQNLGFKQPRFQTILYTLIPPNQKRLFHERTVECLERDISICSNCNYQMERDLKAACMPWQSRNSAMDSGLELYENAKTSILLQSLQTTLLNDTILNFKTCKCSSLQNDSLEQLILHCVSAGLIKKRLTFGLARADILISLNMQNMAKTLLEEIAAVAKTSDDFDSESERRVILASVELLKGELIFNENYVAAKINAVTALRQLGFKFHNRLFIGLHGLELMNDEENESAFLLAGKIWLLLSNYYLVQMKLEKAYSACKVSLRMLDKVESSYIEKCKVYSNLVDISILQKKRIHQKHEALMIELAIHLFPIDSLVTATALIRLLYALYIIRIFADCDITSSLELLRGIQRICESVPSSNAEVKVNIELINIYRYVGDIKNAAGALLRLREMKDVSLLQFHCLNLSFLRTTGFWVVEPDNSLGYIYQELKKDALNEHHHQAAQELFLWKSYNEPSETKIWLGLCKIPVRPRPITCTADISSEMCEIQVILYDCLMKDGQLNGLVRSRLEFIYKTAKTWKICQSFTYFLKAYVEFNFNKHWTQAFELLDRANEIASQQGNILMVARVAATKQAWRHKTVVPLSDIQAREWTEWNSRDWVSTMLRLP